MRCNSGDCNTWHTRGKNIHVATCVVSGSLQTSNHARNITFEDIVVVGVKNPLIINQNYFGLEEESSGEGNAVQISHVTYRNVKGTSSVKDAVVLNCDPTVLDDICITTEDGMKTQGSCTNAQGMCSHCHPIFPCLSNKD